MAQDKKPATSQEAMEAFLRDYFSPQKKLQPELLLGEIEVVLQSKPTPGDFFQYSDDAIAWIGRAMAVLRQWDDTRVGIALIPIESDLHSGRAPEIGRGMRGITALLNEALHTLRLATTGPVNVAIDTGRVFEYFDGVRKLVEKAAQDVLFVDPYLDAEFVIPLTCTIDMSLSIARSVTSRARRSKMG